MLWPLRAHSRLSDLTLAHLKLNIINDEFGKEGCVYVAARMRFISSIFCAHHLCLLCEKTFLCFWESISLPTPQQRCVRRNWRKGSQEEKHSFHHIIIRREKLITIFIDAACFDSKQNLFVFLLPFAMDGLRFRQGGKNCFRQTKHSNLCCSHFSFPPFLFGGMCAPFLNNIRFLSRLA